MTRQRSKSYPVIPLDTAYDVLMKATRAGKKWSREQFANYGAKSNANSVTSGAFMRRVAALREYGLISTDAEGVTLTSLGDRLVNSLNDEEHSLALREAFSNCSIYQSLLEDFGDNKGRPFRTNDIAVAAVTKYGITRDAQAKLVKNFVSSAILAGVITSAGTDEYTATNSAETVPGPAKSSDMGESSFMNAPTQPGAELQVDKPILYEPVSSQFSLVTHQVAAEGVQWTVAAKIQVPTKLDRDLRTKVNEVMGELYELIADLEEKQ